MITSVLKTNGRPVAPGDQKLGWTSLTRFDPGQVKIIIDYIRREIFWAMRENFSLKHCYFMYVIEINEYAI